MFKIELVTRDAYGERRKEIPLVADAIKLGRGFADAVDAVALPECEGRISSHHATIFKEVGQWWLRDGNGKPSRNGITYKGQRITSRVKLESGQTFTLMNGSPLWVELVTSPIDDTVPPIDEVQSWRNTPNPTPDLGSVQAQELQYSRELSAIASNRPEFSGDLAWQLSERQARHDHAISELQRIDAQFQRELEERRRHFEELVEAHEQRFGEALARHDEKLERSIADHDQQFRAALEKLVGEVGAVRQDTQAANRKLKSLTRVCCGLAAIISVFGAVTLSSDEESASKYSQMAIHIITALVTGGGLAAAGTITPNTTKDPNERTIPSNL